MVPSMHACVSVSTKLRREPISPRVCFGQPQPTLVDVEEQFLESISGPLPRRHGLGSILSCPTIQDAPNTICEPSGRAWGTALSLKRKLLRLTCLECLDLLRLGRHHCKPDVHYVHSFLESPSVGV